MRRIELISHPKTDVAETLRKAERLIDERTGIIKDVWHVLIDPDDPKLFRYGSQLADTSRYAMLKCREVNGAAALSREHALAKALGEAIERYCSAIYDETTFVYASYSEVEQEAIDPRAFPLCSEREYRRGKQRKWSLSRFSEQTKMNWVRGYHLGKKQPVLVPACFVYMPYSFTSKEEMIWYPVSTGQACRSTLEEAILTGIFEVVERDAFTIMWLNRLPMPRVDISKAQNKELQEIVRRFAACHIRVYINEIATDIGIPTFCTWAVNQSSSGPAVVVGAATDLNPEAAIQKSLEETAHTRMWVKRLMKDHPSPNYADDYSDVTTFEDHVLLYSRFDALPRLDFILNPSREVKVEEIANLSSNDVAVDIHTCLVKICQKGLDIIVVDITTPDVAEAGFSVVKVLIPGMQPLNANHNYRYLGGTRVYEVPRILGYTDRNTTEEELNPYPHPFP